MALHLPISLDSACDLLAWIGVSWYLIMILMTLSGSIITFRKYRQPPPPPPFSVPPVAPPAHGAVRSQSPPSPSAGPSTSGTIRPGSKTQNLLIPSVSILRPLCGLDAGLRENLESAFMQQWPHERFEVVCCVADPADRAVQVAEEVMAKHPGVNARLLIGAERVGVNPKINNLVEAYRTAKADLLWILDSNTRVHPTTLARAVALLSPPSAPTASRARIRTRIGLVHHVPAGMLAAGDDGGRAAADCLGSLMEACYLNGPHARQYLALNALGVASCLMGKSNLFYRSDLERATARRLRRRQNDQRRRAPDEQARLLDSEQDEQASLLAGERASSPSARPGAEGQSPGAFEALELYAQFLGEDNMIGQTLWDDGIRHATTGDVAGNVVGPMSVGEYVSRRVRWIRARKYMTIVSTLIEPFTEPLLLGVLAMFALERVGLTGGSPKKVLLWVHLLMYLIVDYTVYCSLQRSPLLCTGWAAGVAGGTRTVGGLRFVVGWAAREMLALPVWVLAMSSDQVVWRVKGRTMRVLWDGRVVEC